MLRNFKTKLDLARERRLRRRPTEHGLPRTRAGRLTLEPLETRLLLDAGPLRISEFGAINDQALFDENGDSSDWIEIHNPTDDPVELDGWFLTDDDADLSKWEFPAVTLGAGEYLVVFASGKDRTDTAGELHTNFKLASSGEYLALVHPDASTVAYEFAPEYPGQFTDISYGLVEHFTTLVPEGSELTYLVPGSDDAALGTDWTTTDFDDSEWGGFTLTPPVLITEAGTGSDDWVEIANLSADVVDTSGWVVAVNDAGDGINVAHDVLWTLPESMASEEVLFRTDDDEAGENYFGANVSWKTTGAGWVIIVDDQGNVADFVPWGYDEADLASFAVNINGFDVNIEEAWTGTPVTKNIGRSYTLQRAGGDDHQNASNFDWINPQSEGVLNEGLIAPFPPGKLAGIGFDETLRAFDGLIRTDVQAEMQDVNASLWTRTTFEVEDLDALDTMKLRIKYDDGFVAYLNGQEIARRNAPESVQWDSAATVDRPRASALAFEQIDVSAHVAALQLGTNVLAIQGLNNSVDDGELLILPELIAKADEEVMRHMAQPTPGAHNVMTMAGAMPVFSEPGGTYTESFSLTLSMNIPTPTGVIRYTLDGKIPDENSTEYTGAIPIDGTAQVRARVFEPDLDPGPLVTATYLMLDTQMQNFESQLPIVVVDTFGRGSIGGSTYRASYMSIFEPVEGVTKLTNGQDLGTRMGIKTRGSSSSGWPKHHYTFEAWTEEDNVENEIEPLGMPIESDWILSSFYQFDRALMRNPLIFDLSRQAGRYAARTKYVEVFLNTGDGPLSYTNYMGVYAFMEKLKVDENRIDIVPMNPSATTEPAVTGGYVFKIDRADPGDSGFGAGGLTFRYVYPKENNAGNRARGSQVVNSAQANYLRSAINAADAAIDGPNFADPKVGYAAHIDVSSWIDHNLLNTLMMNVDAYRLSGYWYKDRDGPIMAGPIWDFDRSAESTDGRDNNPQIWAPTENLSNPFRFGWYSRLFQDPYFLQRYIDRWFDLREDVFSLENIMGWIDTAQAEIGQEAASRNFAKWTQVPPRGGSWQAEITTLRTWLTRRLAWIDNQFVATPELTHEGGAIDEPIEFTFTAPGSAVYYTLDGSDPWAPDGQPSPSAKLFNLASETFTDLLAMDDTWTYHDDYVDLGTEWREPGYDDSSWKTGQGTFYHGKASLPEPTNTELDDGSTTYYFRKHLNFDADPQLVTLELRTLIDDGAVIYLNGNEILRLGVDEGELGYRDRSDRSVGTAAIEGPFEISADLFQQGDNVFAVEVHNRRRTDADLAFGMQITAIADTVVVPIEISESTIVTARTYDDSVNNRAPNSPWSPPRRVGFYFNAPAAADNVAITEINYNPYDATPDEQAVDAGFLPRDFEFVELLNVGDEVIDLGQVEFIQGIEVDLNAVVLAPGERAVVVSNRAAFQARYGTEVVVAGEFGGRLDNAGEKLTVADRFEDLILDVRYNDSRSWPGRADGKGASLELIDPAGVPQDPTERTDYLQDSDNWRSSSEFGGSPGYAGAGPVGGVVINEVLTHTPLPALDTIELHNTTDQAVDVGGWFLSDDWGWDWKSESGDYQKYRIEEGTTIAPGGYLLLDESHFNPNGPWNPEAGVAGEKEFALNGARGEDLWLMKGDATGQVTHFVDHVEFGAALEGESIGRWPNATGDVYNMAEYTPGVANSGPRVGPVIISELMYHPARPTANETIDPATFEYVEIYNPTDQAVELTNWRLRKGISFDFRDGTMLAAGGALVVLSFDPSLPANASKVEEFRTYYELDGSETLIGGYIGRLANQGESIQLQRPDEPPLLEPDFIPHVVEDGVDYDDEDPWPTKADGGGHALLRQVLDLPGDQAAGWTSSAPTPGRAGAVEGAAVRGRYVFYNNSAFDLAASGGTDDDAVAPHKQALLPGETATFANYTNYARGINGIMVDIADAAGTPTAADFEFTVGNNNDPSGWSAAPAPQSLAVRQGAGVGGSDRVTIVFADHAIQKQWLQVKVLATAETGLAADDVFYFGNAVGEAGNSPHNAMVNTTDETVARNFQHGPTNMATIDDPYDYNRDMLVNTTDRTIARSNQTGPLDSLRLIGPSAIEAALAQAESDDPTEEAVQNLLDTLWP